MRIAPPTYISNAQPTHITRSWSEEPADSETAEEASRRVGQVSKALAGVPRILESQGWLVDGLHLREALPLVHDVAVGAGALGTVGLLSSGTLEIKDGLDHHNPAEVLAGASEIARGAYLGTWTAGLTGLTPQLSGLGNGLSLLSGGLQLAGGLTRMTHKQRPDTLVNPKVVGGLEAAMGATWIAAFTGVHPTLCLGARFALGAARAGYTHADQLAQWQEHHHRAC